MSRILVTGGTGFIGSHLVERLRSEGREVRALVRPTSDRSGLEARGVECVLGDVRDREAVLAAARDCGLVYHLAAARSTKTSDPREFESVNLAGTERVLRAAALAGAGRVVISSSVGVHGLPKRPLVDEESPLAPDTPYRVSRLGAERIARQVAGETGLPVAIARLTGVYGPRGDDWSRLFLGVARGEFALWGTGEHPYHLSFVADVVDGLVRCGEQPAAAGNCYLVGTAPVPTLAAFLDAIAREAGVPLRRRGWAAAPLRWALGAHDAFGTPLAHRSRWARSLEFFARPTRYDLSKSERELGCGPGVPLAEAVRRTMGWLREQGRLGARLDSRLHRPPTP